MIPNPKHPVSIVIPAYNCEDTIGQTLHAIKKQDYDGPIEIIVVDDGSTDDTVNIVRGFENVIYIYQPNAGPASARNRGFQNAKNEFVAFTDSDCVPNENWVRTLMTHFVDSSIGAVGGSYGIMNDDKLLPRCVYKEIVFRHAMLLPKNPKSLGSYNLCSRRKILFDVNGFNVSYRFASGEDNDLCYKILKSGYQLMFAKGSMVKHYFPEEVSQYLFEQFRHGFWRAKMYMDHPAMSRGDDYTFWKDIVEPPTVLLFIVLTFAGLFVADYLSYALLLFFILITMEILFGIFMMHHFLEGIFYASIMYLRAFARAFGFLVGFPFFLSARVFKKN